MRTAGSCEAKTHLPRLSLFGRPAFALYASTTMAWAVPDEQRKYADRGLVRAGG